MPPIMDENREVGMGAQLRRSVPSLVTFGNLLAGCMALVLITQGRQDLAALMIVAAVLLDAADGALARVFDTVSQFGTQLDSLADMVSFGVAPAMLVISFQDPERFIGWALPVCYVLAAGWRLARFNVRGASSLAHEGFCGLPTTGAGGGVAAVVLAQGFLLERGLELPVAFLPWMLAALAVLMVSPIPYPHAGGLITRWPIPFVVAGAVTLWVGAAQGAYELVFLAFFVAYVCSGPAMLLGAKVKGLGHVHPG